MTPRPGATQRPGATPRPGATAGLLARALGWPKPVRFLFAGGFAAAINWLVRFPLSWAMPFPLAVFVAALIGMTAGFVLYDTIVFPGSQRPLRARLWDFLLVNLVAAGVVVAVAALADMALLRLLAPDLAEAVAHAAGIAAGAGLNFVGHQALTFGDTRRRRTSSDQPC